MEFKIKIDEEDDQKKMASYSSAEVQMNNEEANQNSPQVEKKVEDKKIQNASTSFCSALSFEYYFPLFDIDTIQVGKRMLYSFVPVKASFFPLIQNNPDLYGPFWICTTLIFLIAAAGNFSMYLNEEFQNFSYSFKLVPIAAILIYVYGFLIPLVLFSLIRWFDMNFTYMQILCIYGYSLTCFLPVVCICVLPYSILQWLLLTYAAVNSTFFLLINIWKEISGLHKKSKYILLGVIVGFQVALLLMFKLFFFTKIFSND